ncbi:CotH kinase family protein [Oscillibacter sp.]|uniref:CotH kinase family protein n=1 Tax=Oscillibacter sp. TaxID=1945593 RepID=UPI002896641B|nr:CotH kinase family protein [Oscillibacter sp.]
MLRHKYTTPICIAIVAAMLLTTILFVFGESFGLSVAQTKMPYVESLFSTDCVHTLDIAVEEDDWQEMLDNASDKEYIAASIVLDGNSVKNIGLRTKGNSSLSSIVSSDSDRYSFKIEFDHYQTGQTYYGLDKLALNNIVQDNTYLKDYVSYQMMNAFDADSPLCSFIYITVNGEDWGLYLAVEGIEDAYASRNYGSDSGRIYKPDSMNMMGGGNEDNDKTGEMSEENDRQQFRQTADENAEQQNGQTADTGAKQQTGQAADEDAEQNTAANQDTGDNSKRAARSTENQGGPGGGGIGGESTDVALVYSDDDYDSYSNIFGNAVFDITDSDKDRLISTLKQLSTGEDLEEIVNIEEVLRYFVVHNFVLNFDSYTGSMMHNYYLYEKDGMLSMIAWDYNLAFGAFSGGGNSQSGTTSTTALVNFPIDTPVSGTTLEERPLLGKLLENETYLELYHQLFGEFISSYFDSGEFEQMIDSAIALISPYVEKAPTAFCTYEEFTEASAMLKSFCLLRAQSVQGQLDGIIPSTSENQTADSSSFVDASAIDIKSMGSNAGSMGGGENSRPGGQQTNAQTDRQANGQSDEAPPVPGNTESGEKERMQTAPPGGTENGGQSQNQNASSESGANASQDSATQEDTQTFGQGFPPGGGGQEEGPSENRPQGIGSQQETTATSIQIYYYLAAAVLLLVVGIVVARRFRVNR